MSKILMETIKELRHRTGVGMSKCKEALEKSEGNVDKAIEFLRKSGMASAVKKEGRETKEGSIGTHETKDVIGMIEVDAETDFVTSNEKFQSFLKDLAKQVSETTPRSLEDFLQSPCSADVTMTVDQLRNLLIQTFGENILIKRLEVIKKNPDTSYGIYSHMGGKIVVVVEIEGKAQEEHLARDIAMHIAAESPEYISAKDVPQKIIEKEKEIAKIQIKGKPENIIDKIVEGKMKAYFDQVCLVSQKYVKDSSVTIQELLEKEGKNKNASLSISHFWRWQVGQ